MILHILVSEFYTYIILYTHNKSVDIQTHTSIHASRFLFYWLLDMFSFIVIIYLYFYAASYKCFIIE